MATQVIFRVDLISKDNGVGVLELICQSSHLLQAVSLPRRVNRIEHKEKLWNIFPNGPQGLLEIIWRKFVPGGCFRENQTIAFNTTKVSEELWHSQGVGEQTPGKA